MFVVSILNCIYFNSVIILLARYTTPCVRHSNLLGHFAAAYELKPSYCPCLSLGPCLAYTYRTLLQYWHKQRRCSWSPFLLIIQARGIGGRAGVDQLQNPNPLLDIILKVSTIVTLQGHRFVNLELVEAVLIS